MLQNVTKGPDFCQNLTSGKRTQYFEVESSETSLKQVHCKWGANWVTGWTELIWTEQGALVHTAMIIRVSYTQGLRGWLSDYQLFKISWSRNPCRIFEYKTVWTASVNALFKQVDIIICSIFYIFYINS